MRFRNMVFIVLIAATVFGFFMVDQAQALSFANWEGTWFKVKASETGKAGIVVSPITPNGGEVDTNNEKTTTSYLVIDSYDITPTAFSETVFTGRYCVSNGTAWVNHAASWPVLGGEPEYFLTFFTYSLDEIQNNSLQTSWIPLEVKGKASKNAPSEITSASFKNLGGIFREEIGSAIPYGGVGIVKFTGSFIKPDQVPGTVPPDCLLPLP
jgi:hypothetical protein